ncbi:hypothetical protein GGI07_003772 [Coemansia sp. Benny D115]|nr:hypothetical protein GGI07_003772 [Coemansia sp. Benny D115]
MDCAEPVRDVGEMLRQSVEYKQRSPHPSRPSIPAVVDAAVWSDIHSLFQALAHVGQSGGGDGLSVDNDAMKVLYEALGCLCMFVRNAAAMDRANQDAAEAAGVMDDIRHTVSAMADHDELVYQEAAKCRTVAAQALSNMVTGNKPLQRRLMEQELSVSCNGNSSDSGSGRSGAETVYWRLLDSASSQTNMAGLMLLLNSLKGDQALAERFCATESGRKVGRKLGEHFGEIGDELADVKNMLYVLLAQFTESGCLPLLLANSATAERVGLLKALSVYCNENQCTEANSRLACDSDAVAALASVLDQVHTLLVHVWKEIDAEDGGANAAGTVDMNKIIAAHMSLSAALSAIGALTTDCSTAAVDVFIQHRVVHHVVALLGLLNKYLPRIEAASALLKHKEDSSIVSGQSDGVEAVGELFMFKRDLIRILGNLANENAAAQDLVRELDGLALVLDHLKIDGNHPFIKEYAIVALKCLTKNNAASQEFIRSMDARGVAQEPSADSAPAPAPGQRRGESSSALP